MKKEEFKTVIKALSFWKIDKRKGNYALPDGTKLKVYLEELAEKFLDRMELGISKSEEVFSRVENEIFVNFKENEKTTDKEQSERVEKIIKEMIF